MLPFKSSIIQAGCALVLSALTASCGGDSTAPPLPGLEPSEQLEIVRRPSSSDTVDAILSDSLVIVVRDSLGNPVAGDSVLLIGSQAGDRQPTMYFWRENLGAWGYYAPFRTDGRGRLALPIRMGPYAGSARLIVAITRGQLSLADTITFTTLPGQVHSVAAVPADTALLANRSFDITTSFADRHGNSRTGTAVFTSFNDALTVDAAGHVATTRIGRSAIIAAAGAARDTTWVSVVPRMRLAIAQWEKLILVQSDGTDRREFTFDGKIAGLGWLPGSSEILVSFAGSDWPRLMAVDTVTGGMRRVIPPTPGIGAEYSPIVSADGAFIYFTVDNAQGAYEIWRVRPDGTQATELTTLAPTVHTPYTGTPSPAPQQTHVVASLGHQQLATLEVIALADGNRRALGRTGWSPLWSRVDDRIAFHAEDGLHIINADGSGDHRISSADRINEGAFNWTPDGRWLLVCVNRVSLVESRTGEALSLQFVRFFLTSGRNISGMMALP